MLADATRVRIVLALEDADKFSVSALAEVIDKSPAAVSQQLAKLRLARIVATRQEGQKIFYRLENEHASRLVADAILQAEHSLGGSPAITMQSIVVVFSGTHRRSHLPRGRRGNRSAPRLPPRRPHRRTDHLAAIFILLIGTIRSVGRRLLDGVEPELVDKVARALAHVEGIEHVDRIRIRLRWNGHRLEGTGS